jgi:hypothetical protein
MPEKMSHFGVLHGETPETKMPAKAGILREKGRN